MKVIVAEEIVIEVENLCKQGLSEFKIKELHPVLTKKSILKIHDNLLKGIREEIVINKQTRNYVNTVDCMIKNTIEINEYKKSLFEKINIGEKLIVKTRRMRKYIQNEGHVKQKSKDICIIEDLKNRIFTFSLHDFICEDVKIDRG